MSETSRGWWLAPEAAVLVILILIAVVAPPASAPDHAIADLAARTIENSSPVDKVWTVYGYYFCAAGAPGVPYLQSARSDGPVVVTQLTAAPLVLIVRSGPLYAERVRAMMPDQYEQWCFSGLRDDAVAGEVRRRYEKAVGA